MNELIASLVEKSPVITDGAWGTQLQARGLPVGESGDAWNLSNPEKVEEVARAYVEAGSQIIIANTFQACSLTLERHGLAEKASEINRAGAEISRRAACDKAHVFASMGPSGKMLMMGEISEEALLGAFQRQARALAEGGADAIVLETMTDLAEAKVALRAAKETGLPVVACMTFDSGAELDRTMMGTAPEEAAKELIEADADVIGANCGQGIEGYIAICSRLKASTDLPIWIKANAGIPEMIDGVAVYKAKPEDFAAKATEVVAAGANFIGGCCGTTPDFVRALKASL